MGSAIYFIKCKNCGGSGCIDDEYKIGVKTTDCTDCEYRLIETCDVETGEVIEIKESGKN
jgi:hypothetical protein